MLDLTLYLWGLAASAAVAFAAWLVSLLRNDVSVIDSAWSLMVLAAAAAYALGYEPAQGAAETWRATLAIWLATLWALRLSLYLTWRNWGQPEDRRYQVIRARNQPGFRFKSLYLVFGLQAALAWVVSLPLLGAVTSQAPLGLLDLAGLALFAVGFGFEALADWQMQRFKARPDSAGRVMDRGLWRYSRHPNYFGEACLWWGLFAIAAGGGAWWALVSPLLMTVLLLKVSGVTMLESDLVERRPEYRDYIARTNAFVPGPPRAAPSPSQASR